MIKRIIDSVIRWDSFILKQPIFNAIFSSMRQTVPILAVSVYLQLTINIFLKPDALVTRLFGISVKFPNFINLQEISSHLDIIVLMIFATTYSLSYLSVRQVSQKILPTLINFLGPFFILTENNKVMTYSTMHYLLIIIVTTVSCESFTYYKKKFCRNDLQPFSARYLLWAGIILSFYLTIHRFSIANIFQQIVSGISINQFWTTFQGLIIFSFLVPLFFGIGFSIPNEFFSNQTALPSVIKNLDEILKNKNSILPYPTNLYSVYHAFSQFGGVGNTLVLSFMLLYAVSKKRQNLGFLSLLPSLFDQNQLLYFGLPIFFRPIILFPMLITSIMGTIIGYLAIVSHLIKPASLIIPNEIPNFLLSFLGSNDGWTLILNTFIIFISIIVYSPFIKIQNSEVDYEK